MLLLSGALSEGSDPLPQDVFDEGGGMDGKSAEGVVPGRIGSDFLFRSRFPKKILKKIVCFPFIRLKILKKDGIVIGIGRFPAEAGCPDCGSAAGERLCGRDVAPKELMSLFFSHSPRGGILLTRKRNRARFRNRRVLL